MVVSLFCTGYASWTINPYVNEPLPELSVDGNLVSYEVDDLRLSAHGIGLSATGAKTFTYCTVTAGGATTGVEQYTGKTLAISVNVNASKIKSHDDYRQKDLVITCEAYAKDGGNSIKKSFAKTASSTLAISEINGISYYLSPSAQCKVTLKGYPNLYLSATVSLVGDALSVTIPLEQIYNLTVLDKASLNASVLSVEIDFNELVAEQISTICSLTYSFTAKLVKN